MANALDQFMDAAREVANKAVDTAENLAARGRDKLDRMSLENELAKAQRQLGALVYSLRKSGEENPGLVDHYIEIIAGVEEKLNEHEAAQAERYCVSICPECGAEVAEDAGFCSHCGAKLS
ncbi:zinc ribbon domain-containing protein [Anaerofilum hominis]|nr:zinc ribbon domain-containing protein [Anaerofilum hominis]